MPRDTDGSPGGNTPARHDAFVVVGLGMLVVVVNLVVGRMPSSASPTFNASAGFVISLSAVGLLAWRLLTTSLPPWRTAGVALVALALAVGLARLGWIWPAVPFKVTAAVLLGTLLGRVMEAPSWLLLAAAVAFIADLWSVFAGPTKVVVEKAPQVLDYALVHFPTLGSIEPGVGLGMTDLLFVAVFVSGSRRLGLRPLASFLAMLGSFVLTLLLTITLERALPALPLLALAFLAANADLFWKWARERRA